MKIIVAFCLMLISASSVCSAWVGPLPLVNASFETGDFTGWTKEAGYSEYFVMNGAAGQQQDGTKILRLGNSAPLRQWVGSDYRVQPYSSYTLSVLASVPPGQNWIGQGKTSNGYIYIGLATTYGSESDITWIAGQVICTSETMAEYSVSFSSTEHPEWVGKYLLVKVVVDSGWTNYVDVDRVKLDAVAASMPQPTIALSSWVWDWWDTDIINTCDRKNLKTLYYGLDFPITGSWETRMENLLDQAHQRGIRVEASCHYTRDRPYEYMDAVLAWNQSHPSSQRFDGAHFDWEIYSTEWLGILQNIWGGTTLAQLKQLDPSFKLGAVGVPALWWGTEAQRQAYAYKLQDYTDYVTVMSYFLGDRTLNFFTGPSKPAIDYATATGKKIYVGLETTFWPGEGNNYPGWEYASFASQGENELRYRIDRINSTLGVYSGFGGVALECYGAYQRLILVQDEINADGPLYRAQDSTAETLTVKDSGQVSISSFSSGNWYSAEDASMQTLMATFSISPALSPGRVLSCKVTFGAWSAIRHNPVSESYVPAELLWFGFLQDSTSSYRSVRVDHNGSLGIRVADPVSPSRMAYQRFTPTAGKTYEYRLYFLSDSRILAKIIDPASGSLLWRSDRMGLARTSLPRMYVEVTGTSSSSQITYDGGQKTIRVYKDGTLHLTMSDLYVTSAYPMTTGQLKAQPDGAKVVLDSMTVTAGTNQFSTTFYVEDNDRSSGIKVSTGSSGISALVGNSLDIVGTIGTVTGERTVTNPSAYLVASSSPVPEPLVMQTKQVGGSTLNAYTPGVYDGLGLHNTGLLVRVWGRVTNVNATSKFFYLDDGSGYRDGSGQVGVQVFCGGLASGNSITLPAINQFVTVTGISARKVVSGRTIPMVRPRNQSDIALI